MTTFWLVNWCNSEHSLALYDTEMVIVIHIRTHSTRFKNFYNTYSKIEKPSEVEMRCTLIDAFHRSFFFSWAPFFWFALVSGCESWPNSILYLSYADRVKCAAILPNKGALRSSQKNTKTYDETTVNKITYTACYSDKRQPTTRTRMHAVIQVKPKCHRSWRKCVITHFLRALVHICWQASVRVRTEWMDGMRRYELAAWHAPCDV